MASATSLVSGPLSGVLGKRVGANVKSESHVVQAQSEEPVRKRQKDRNNTREKDDPEDKEIARL